MGSAGSNFSSLDTAASTWINPSPPFTRTSVSLCRVLMRVFVPACLCACFVHTSTQTSTTHTRTQRTLPQSSFACVFPTSTPFSLGNFVDLSLSWSLPPVFSLHHVDNLVKNPLDSHFLTVPCAPRFEEIFQANHVPPVFTRCILVHTRKPYSFASSHSTCRNKNVLFKRA